MLKKGKRRQRNVPRAIRAHGVKFVLRGFIFFFRSREVAFIYAQMFVKKGHPSSIFRNERCLFFKGIRFKIESSKSFSS